MTKHEALKVKVGDKLTYQDYSTFTVTDVTESTIGKPSIVFWGENNKGLKVGYPHRMCRRYDDVRTEESNKAN